jgi:hypothetical protein
MMKDLRLQLGRSVPCQNSVRFRLQIQIAEAQPPIPTFVSSGHLTNMALRPEVNFFQVIDFSG